MLLPLTQNVRAWVRVEPGWYVLVVDDTRARADAVTRSAPCCLGLLTEGARMREAEPMPYETEDLHNELERVRRTFAQHVAEMSADDLRRRSNGTRWTNRQLLFHMLFGYLIVRALMVMIKIFGVLPRGASKPFAALLDFLTPGFHRVNYLGSVVGGRILTPQRMLHRLLRVTAAIERDLVRQTERSLGRGMYYPTRWDPYFNSYMTLADLYRYPGQHFDHHDLQLS